MSGAMQMDRIKRVIRLTITFSYFLLIIALNIPASGGGKGSLMDFGSFYASGIKIQNGENPYDPNSPYIFDVAFPEVNAGGKMINLNPPLSIVFFSFLPRVEPWRALATWRVVTILLYFASVLALAKLYSDNLTSTRLIWAFTLAGFWHTVSLGQIYALLLAFTTASWYFAKKEKPLLAGIALGIVIAIKPNFAIWAIFLLFAGQWTIFAAAAICAATLSAIPIFMYGFGIYAQWLAVSAVRHATLIMPGNNSIEGLTSRVGLDNVGAVLGVIVAVFLLYRATRLTAENPERIESASTLGILATLLASPIAWTGYTILLLPTFFSLKKWSPLVIAAAFIFSIPFIVLLQIWLNSFANFVIFGWLYGWGLLCLVWEFTRNSTAASNAL